VKVHKQLKLMSLNIIKRMDKSMNSNNSAICINFNYLFYIVLNHKIFLYINRVGAKKKYLRVRPAIIIKAISIYHRLSPFKKRNYQIIKS